MRSRVRLVSELRWLAGKWVAGDLVQADWVAASGMRELFEKFVDERNKLYLYGQEQTPRGKRVFDVSLCEFFFFFIFLKIVFF